MGRVSGVMVGVIAAVALVGSSCGGDDDASNGGDGTDSRTAESSTVDGGAVAEGDLVAGMMAVFGGAGAVEILTDEERDCMNEALAPSFPQGLPPGLTANEEFEGVLDALNGAAEICDVTL